MENVTTQDPLLTNEASQPLIQPTPPRKSKLVRTVFIVLALILFGVLIGVVAARYIFTPNTNISSPIVTQTPTISPTPTPNFQDLPFEISYPEGWKEVPNFIQDPPRTQYLRMVIASSRINTTDLEKLEAEPFVEVFIKPLENSDNFDNWLTEFSSFLDVKISKISKFGVKTTVVTGPVGLGIRNMSRYLFISPDYKYMFAIVTADDEKNIRTKELDQILSSFKFVEQDLSLSPDSKIILNILNLPSGGQSPQKILFEYQREPNDKIFMINDEYRSGVQKRLIIQRNDIILFITPEFEGFPLAHTNSLAVEVDNQNLSLGKIYRTASENAKNSYRYVNNYSLGSTCGEYKENTIACSGNNIETVKGVSLDISCQALSVNAPSCDQIVKTLNILNNN